MKKQNALLRLLKDSKKHWGWLSLFVLLYFLAGIFKSEIAMLIGQMTDTALIGGAALAMTFILPLGLLLLLEWIRGILNYIVTAQTTERMFFDFKLRVFNKLSKIKVDTIENKLRSGDVVSRVNGDLNNLCEIIAGSFTWYMRVIFTATAAFVSCIVLSWELSLVYFILMPPTFFVMERISKPLKSQQSVILKKSGQSLNVANEIIGANEVVKSFGLKEEMNSHFAKITDNAANIEIESEKINVKMTAIKYIGMIIPMVIMLVFGIILVSRGVVTPGTVIAFSALCGQVRGLLEIYNLIIRTYRQSDATCERLYELLDLPEEDSGHVTTTNGGDIILQANDLSFSYQGKSPVIDRLNLEIKQGEKVALVGKSGCGKSTMLKLACKFYTDNIDGELKLFGVNTNDWKNDKLREKIALVSQDSFLFQDTIYNNVLIGNPKASETQVLSAMKSANILDFVNSLPQQANTWVGDGGVQLSGGQRQRIAIARAFLKDAPLILLDEPTSALDKQSESEVQKALDVLLQNRTSIVIAHRLYTLKNMDKIYFMGDNGKIIEQGTWEELVSLKGRFNELLERSAV